MTNDHATAIAERDRLRRELKTLRVWVKEDLAWRETSSHMNGVTLLRKMRDRIDAILRGES